MSSNYQGRNRVGKLTVYSPVENLPMWSILHYLLEFNSSYNKLALINKVCDYLEDCNNKAQIVIANYSIDTYSYEDLVLSIDDDVIKRSLPYIELIDDERTLNLLKSIYLFTKSQDRRNFCSLYENPELFWERFGAIRQPYVLISKTFPNLAHSTVIRLLNKTLSKDVIDESIIDNLLIPIMNYVGEDAFKVTNFQHHSPFIADIAASIKHLLEISNSRRLTEEELKLLRSKQAGQVLENIGIQAYTLERILNANIPEPNRKYMLSQYYGATMIIDKLNKELGIVVKDIRYDERA